MEDFVDDFVQGLIVLMLAVIVVLLLM